MSYRIKFADMEETFIRRDESSLMDERVVSSP